MKLFAQLMFAAFFFAFCVLPAAGAQRGSRVDFDTKELTFPNVREGVKITAEFPFTNTGSSNLEIMSINTSCGCTTADYDRLVAPGERGMVTLILDTNNIVGAFRKTAVVKTNDPSNPVVTLVMIGETQSRIKLDVGRRIELIGCQGEPTSASATVSDAEGKPLVLAGVENPMAQYLDARLTPSADGKTYKLTLTVKTTDPIEFAGPVFLVVPGSTKISVYVVVEVRGPVVVQPNEVHFGNISKSQTHQIERTILVRKACIDSFNIDSMGFNSSKFSVREQWAKLGESVNLIISPNIDKLPVGPIDEKFTVEAGGRLHVVLLKGTVSE
ncbi:MAG: DUF1573 domain-containing protein [Desulfarculales bacterium]|jgi:hypothetical protein|nr:DUF1573 domain-containing protein [Desulfarculales bacterium]